ncbi:MAG TPA: hypothetical protein VGG71_07890, partial [Chitinophagaceae bacterium]
YIIITAFPIKGEIIFDQIKGKYYIAPDQNIISLCIPMWTKNSKIRRIKKKKNRQNNKLRRQKKVTKPSLTFCGVN